MTDPVVAWRDFCARMSAAGEQLLGEEWPADPAARAEGIHHLANQVACWLTHGMVAGDPEHPAWFRSSDPVFRWGGPNVDQVARRARIDGRGVYRVSGRMGSCEEFVLQIKTGAVQTGGADIVTEIYASQLGLGPGDPIDIVLGGDSPGAHPLDPAATFLHVRDYYYDWHATEPATFVLERLDPTEPPAPPGPGAVAGFLDDTAGQIEHSMVFWRDYQIRMRADGELNVFSPPAYMGRGVQDIVYAHAFVRLPSGHALVVELDPAAADVWGAGMYNRVWYEPLDFAHRLGSLNHRQAVADADGVVRLVLCGPDPGCANWLDTQGRDEVLATIRWSRPPEIPSVTATVVALDELPPTIARVTPSERTAQVEARAAHVAWRFRT